MRGLSQLSNLRGWSQPISWTAEAVRSRKLSGWGRAIWTVHLRKHYSGRKRQAGGSDRDSVQTRAPNGTGSGRVGSIVAGDALAGVSKYDRPRPPSGLRILEVYTSGTTWLFYGARTI